MPELPELEALRLQLGPRLEGRLVTAVEVNPKSGHLLRYPPETFAHELPYRKFSRAWRRGKHLVFDLQLARGGGVPHPVRKPQPGGPSPPAAGGRRGPAAPAPALVAEAGG